MRFSYGAYILSRVPDEEQVMDETSTEQVVRLKRQHAESRWKRCSNCDAGLFTDETRCYFHPPSPELCIRNGHEPLAILGPDGECGGDLIEPTDGQCTKAALAHGPGHQSYTRCSEPGEHDVHRCVYGEFRQEAWWRGDGLTMSGFFDEPPKEQG